MNIAVTLTFSTVAEALAAIDQLNGRAAGSKTVTVVDAPASERRKTRGKKAEDAPVLMTIAEGAIPNVGDSSSTGDEVQPIEPQGASEESAKEAIHAYANAHGVPAAKALLQEFGVARTSELTDPLKRYELIVRISKELK